MKILIMFYQLLKSIFKKLLLVVIKHNQLFNSGGLCL
jgi:hypothetical protein